MIEAELPRIGRARGYRLYGLDGRRYLDFWQADGRALLGHRPAGAASAVKAAVDRGLWAELPSVWNGRLERSLARYFQNSAGRSFRWFASEERALAAASRLLGRPVEQAEPWSLPEGGRAELVRWRPWWRGSDDRRLPPAAVVLPVLPFPAAFAPQLAVFEAGPAGEAAPAGDAVSPLLLAGLAAALAGLEAFGAKALPDWPAWRLRGFERRGPYLSAAYAPEKHAAVFARLLKAGFVINPDPRRPSILPGEWSAGEKQLAERAFAAAMEEADAIR